MGEPKIRVVCPGCGKGIKAPERWRGRTVPCPGCESDVVIGEIPSSDPAPQDAGERPCPYCQEMVPRDVRRCKHCHAFMLTERDQEGTKKTAMHLLKASVDDTAQAAGAAAGVGCVAAVVLFALFAFAVLLLSALAGCGPATPPVAPSRSVADYPLVFEGELYGRGKGDLFRFCQQIPNDQDAANFYVWSRAALNDLAGEAAMRDVPFAPPIHSGYKLGVECRGIIYTDGETYTLTIDGGGIDR